MCSVYTSVTLLGLKSYDIAEATYSSFLWVPAVITCGLLLLVSSSNECKVKLVVTFAVD